MHPTTTAQQPEIHQDSMNLVFANRSEEEVIYPLTVNEIAEAQISDPSIQKLASDKRYTMQLVETHTSDVQRHSHGPTHSSPS